MNKFLLCLSFALVSLTASSQKVYFIYLQSESEQPFFVKFNEKILSSTSSGYLIIPKLVDSTYQISLGFPRNEFPEQKFTVTLNKKDHGYLVKNFGEKGWGLFNLQTLAVEMSTSAGVKKESASSTENRSVSAFTEILAKAADDPSLRDRPVLPKPEEKKPEIITAVVKEEPKTEIKSEPAKTQPETAKVIVPEKSKDEPKPDPALIPAVNKEISVPEKKEPAAPAENPVVVTNDEPKKEQPSAPVPDPKHVEEYKRSVVTKRSESSTTEGFGLVFVDDDKGVKDTIRLIIPNAKPLVTPMKEEPKEEKKFLDLDTESSKKDEEKKASVTNTVVQETAKKEEEKKPEATAPVVTDPAKKEEVKTSTVTPPAVSAPEKCPVIAAEADFFLLRKQMAAVEGDEEMIGEAKKQFRQKCFTTSQIRNLGTLFLNDEGKYKFFDAAYPHVTDPITFTILQYELKDDYYKTRFRAMLR